MHELFDVLLINPTLTLLYVSSGVISIFLGFLLIRYYSKNKNIVAKYLSLSITFIGLSIISYLLAFIYYTMTGELSYETVMIISLSNILIGTGILFLVFYLHSVIFKEIRNIVKVMYSLPILAMIYIILFMKNFNLLRLYLGYSLLPLIIILLLYVLYFIRISLKIYLDNQNIPELRLGAITHIISMSLAIIAIGSQLLGKLYHLPLFSYTASFSLFTAFISIALLYLPTTFPSWYVKLAKRLL